ncbi:MAG: N-acetylmuramoyl-L-alanine amidase family protein [Dysgonomonas sp.]
MKKLIYIFCFFLIISGKLAAADFTVVIDAGHGGKDGGAVRGKTKEKDINLAIALNLGRLIEDNYKDVKVVYTRKADVFVELKRRAEIANKAQANLFISIHTNSTEAKITNAAGADTYILGLDRSAENMRVAQRENSVILLEDNYKQKYEDFDPKSPESYIIFEFMTNKYMEQSLDFASQVQTNFKKVARREDRGVRQAGFLVLRETAAPSVLIELGFINNPNEAKYLTSTIGQRSMASAIYAGFQQYKKDFDKRQGLATIGGGDNSNPTFVEKKDKTVTTNTVTTTTTKTPETPQAVTKQGNNQTYVTKPKTSPVVETKTETTIVQRTVETVPTYTEPKNSKPASQNERKNIPNNAIEYRIQFYISQYKLPNGSSEFRGLSPVDYYVEGNTFKYTYGSTTDLNEAIRIQRQVRTKFKDAFTVKFRNGIRIK